MKAVLVRGALAILFILYLSGMASCGPRPKQQDISEIEYLHPKHDRLIQDDASVDLFAQDLVKLLTEHGFRDPRVDTSYGLEPWTGHTQNVSATLAANSGVFIYAAIAKCCIKVTFSELETGIGTNQYSSSPDDRSHIQRLQQAIDTLIRSSTSLGPSQ